MIEELKELKSFAWQGTKKNRYTLDKWSSDKNCRPLKASTATANALLTGKRQLDKTGRWKLIAVDLDKKDNWQEVINTYKELNLPSTLTVATPSGGYHLFFWILKDIIAQNINDDRHCKHFELKGDNNNITAPGSTFECGATYTIIKNIPIAHLLPNEAYRLCKYKKPWMPLLPKDQLDPDLIEIETMAKYYDPQAKHCPRGWYFRCPYHEDHRASAILFNNGWFFCSGCGKKQKMVKSKVI